MIVGFTGTQQGMSDDQKGQFAELLVGLSATTLHHGDCIGADAQAHELARLADLEIVLHPPKDDSKRAHCDADEMRDPLPYLERNHVIVDEVDIVIAAPFNDYEVLRSGTWATVRYARANHVPVIVMGREPAEQEGD